MLLVHWNGIQDRRCIKKKKEQEEEKGLFLFSIFIFSWAAVFCCIQTESQGSRRDKFPGKEKQEI